ncbi:hypothetical protein [Chroococcidiopsis sp [FACHB-1243]]|uniref:hypothetical protein n=1 Tax=Chroococcidiopsis sp. [FACHB-1243] TaxID=2692781 RepID=UPI00177ECB0A|nr:hypothetical protein [Chroococcidiopsis sp. [FACHB-1243]]
MSTRKISLLQSVATILAVQSRSSRQQQTQPHCSQVVQKRGEIVKLLAKSSQPLLLMPSYDAA